MILAMDLDRTLIFSERFIKEHNNSFEDVELVEEKDGKPISYISKEVLNKLRELISIKDLTIVPITSRTLEETYRIKFINMFKYIICDSGGMMIKNSTIVSEYDSYINSKNYREEMMELLMNIEELESVTYARICDSRFIFGKTDNPNMFDLECQEICDKYTNFRINRVGNKWYAIPEHFNKAIALRFLMRMINDKTLIASGDSLMDATMLSIADYATVPDHGELVKDKIVLDGNIITGGINSPLETFRLAEEIINKNKI